MMTPWQRSLIKRGHKNARLIKLATERLEDRGPLVLPPHQRAKERHAALLRQIANAESAMKIAKDKAAEALKQLMHVVGVA